MKHKQTRSQMPEINLGKLARTLLTIVVGFNLIIMAGCSGIVGENSPTEGSSPTQSITSETRTAISTPTPSPTSTPTPTEDGNLTSKEKYSHFRDGYVKSLENKSVNVSNTTINSKNDTLYLTYEMRDPNTDKFIGWERANISLLYVVGVEVYINHTKTPDVDKTWVPNRVNVTAVTPEGERYETAYTTFERAKMMIDGDISERRYLLEYYGTIEPGPANPEYNK